MTDAFVFQPDSAPAQPVPYFEDADSTSTQGHRTRRTVPELQREIQSLMSQMGVGAVAFEPGMFPGQPKRYGFRLTFVSVAGDNVIRYRMPVAALPMRAEAPARKEAALRQALYAFARYLEGELLAMQFRPNYAPFVGFAVLPDGRTLNEHIAERTGLLLPSG